MLWINTCAYSSATNYSIPSNGKGHIVKCFKRTSDLAWIIKHHNKRKISKYRINVDSKTDTTRCFCGKVTVFLEKTKKVKLCGIIKSQRTVNNHSGKICWSVFLIHIPREEMHIVMMFFFFHLFLEGQTMRWFLKTESSCVCGYGQDYAKCSFYAMRKNYDIRKSTKCILSGRSI